MSSSCAMGATTSGGSPSCASSLAVRRYMCPLGVMCVRYMCPLFIYMELSVYMELSRLSGRLNGDSGRLCGTTLATVSETTTTTPAPPDSATTQTTGAAPLTRTQGKDSQISEDDTQTDDEADTRTRARPMSNTSGGSQLRNRDIGRSEPKPRHARMSARKRAARTLDSSDSDDDARKSYRTTAEKPSEAGPSRKRGPEELRGEIMLPTASHGRDIEDTNSKPAKTRRKAQETSLTLPPTRGPPTGDAEADEGGGARRRKTKKNKRERHMDPQSSKRPRKVQEDKNKKRKRNDNQRSMDEFTVTQAKNQCWSSTTPT